MRIKKPGHSAFRPLNEMVASLTSYPAVREHMKTAFQCHKTIDYDNFDDPAARAGDKPQQCAGLVALLRNADMPNAIMTWVCFSRHWTWTPSIPMSKPM